MKSSLSLKVLAKLAGEKGKDISRILNNKCPLLRSRCCHLLRQLGRCSCRALQNAWSPQLRSELENLLDDSSDLVREVCIIILSRTLLISVLNL